MNRFGATDRLCETLVSWPLLLAGSSPWLRARNKTPTGTRRVGAIGRITKRLTRPDARRGTTPAARHGGLLPEDAEEQQCLVVLRHAVPCDLTHDHLPELPEWLVGVVPE